MNINNILKLFQPTINKYHLRNIFYIQTYVLKINHRKNFHLSDEIFQVCSKQNSLSFSLALFFLTGFL